MKNHQQYYQQLVKGALLCVMRDILAEVSQHGLKGDQHFYITFSTSHDGVRLAQHLKARYPERMTVVLQYQFDHLIAHQDCFEVTLTFDNVAEHISVPYDAISQFADPSAPFVLNMEQNQQGQSPPQKDTAGKKKHENNVIAISDFQKKKSKIEPSS